MMDGAPVMPEENRRRVAWMVRSMMAAFVLERIARGATKVEIIFSIVLAPGLGLISWLVYRQATKPLGWLCAAVSVLFASFLASITVLYFDKMKPALGGLVIVSVFIIVIPAVVSFLLLSGRLKLPAMPFSPATPEQRTKQMRWMALSVPVLIVFLYYSVTSAIASGPESAPVRLYAIAALALFIGFDGVRSFRQLMHSSH